MSIQLFIGNLNFKTTHETLLDELKKYGEIIKLEIRIDRFTLKSRGFAHALVPDKKTADKIIEAFKGKELDGRPLRIELYNEN